MPKFGDLHRSPLAVLRCTGKRGEDSISTSNIVYIVPEWWQQPTPRGTDIRFTTKPSPNMIEMPVLFWNPPDPQGRTDLVAFTNNVVNSLVDGNTLFIPRTWGPKVMPNNEDLFAYYSREAAKKVGFVTVTASEERVYHNNSGSIHCGTNVLRQIPDVDADKWWKNL